MGARIVFKTMDPAERRRLGKVYDILLELAD
jgi:hypothetical protein